jgi:hypothetical protein
MAMQYVAEHQGDALAGVNRIADQFGLRVELLAKVLERLTKGGLMVAQSWPRGGYRLAAIDGDVGAGDPGSRKAAGDREVHGAPRRLCAGVAPPAPEPGAEAPGGDHRPAEHDDAGRTRGRRRAGRAGGAGIGQR